MIDKTSLYTYKYILRRTSFRYIFVKIGMMKGILLIFFIPFLKTNYRLHSFRFHQVPHTVNGNVKLGNSVYLLFGNVIMMKTVLMGLTKRIVLLLLSCALLQGFLAIMVLCVSSQRIYVMIR